MRPVRLRRIAHPVEYGTARGQGQPRTQGFAVSCGTVGPVGLDRIPELAESLLIRVAVLYDQCRDALRMPERQTVTDRCAVVLHVQRVAIDTELIQETVHQLGEAGEAVLELVTVRRGAVTERWIVGRDHPVAVSERRNQVAEHVRRGGKAVQQEHRRCICRAGLAIEDVYSIDFDRAIAGDGRVCVHGPRLWRRRVAGRTAADSAPTMTSIDIAE